MLVLINGLSGNVGHAVATSLLARGHQVRGLGRSPENVDATLRARLESFVTAKNWYDTAAHDQACSGGVDAVVHAGPALPVQMLDAQLLLLRATERAGISIFVAGAWNYNWTRTEFGYMETYDPLIAFKQQVELTSEIRPIYIFTGVLAEFWFGLPVRGWFQRENPAFNPKRGSAMYFGDGKLRHQLTSFRDCGEYTAELLLSPSAAEGGCFEVMSFGADVWQMQEAYQKITGKDIVSNQAGTLEDLKQMALKAREAGKKNEFLKYAGILYFHLTIEGRWLLNEDHLYASKGIHPQSLEGFLEEHKEFFKDWPLPADETK